MKNEEELLKKGLRHVLAPVREQRQDLAVDNLVVDLISVYVMMFSLTSVLN